MASEVLTNKKNGEFSLVVINRMTNGM